MEVKKMKVYRRKNFNNIMLVSTCAGLLVAIIVTVVYIATMMLNPLHVNDSMFKLYVKIIMAIAVVFFFILPFIFKKVMLPDFEYAIGNVPGKFIRIRLSDGWEYDLKGEVVCLMNSQSMTLIDEKGTMVPRIPHDDDVISALKGMGVSVKVKRRHRHR